MSQTNVIVLRIAKDKTKEFEQLFKAEQYENWKRYHAAGKFLAARSPASSTGAKRTRRRRAGT